MNPLTLRNLPPEIAEVIRKQAEKQGWSLNKTVIALISEAVKPTSSKKPNLHHDLDRLSGSWTAKEAKAFDESLNAQRTIDPELWQ